MTVAWPALRLLNHLTMTTGLPLADIQLAAADNMMGFDWITYLGLLDRAPTLLGIMDFLYTSLSIYVAAFFIIVALFSREPLMACREFISIFFLSALTFSLVGSFFPALSAATHYAPLPEFNHFDPHIGAYHLDHLVALRTDIDHRLNLANMPGLVTFPSFHTAIGIIAIYCCRSMPLLLALSLLLNSLMIASTPLFGAHYLIDIIGGTFIAIAIIALYRIGSRLPVHIPPIDDRAPATNSY
ncbi:phosphatase PAP2 family protein [Sphingopyxis granuli]|nr:phosphatase PAP2 family protein [Sphingopyxis granuli]